MKEDGLSRVGKINTQRGEIDTPTFMPVGTQGTIKSVFTEDMLGLSLEELAGMVAEVKKADAQGDKGAEAAGVYLSKTLVAVSKSINRLVR